MLSGQLRATGFAPLATSEPDFTAEYAKATGNSSRIKKLLGGSGPLFGEKFFQPFDAENYRVINGLPLRFRARKPARTVLKFRGIKRCHKLLELQLFVRNFRHQEGHWEKP
jgi:hypothetical protein